jgi:hypothetical protein
LFYSKKVDNQQKKAIDKDKKRKDLQKMLFNVSKPVQQVGAKNLKISQAGFEGTHPRF